IEGVRTWIGAQLLLVPWLLPHLATFVLLFEAAGPLFAWSPWATARLRIATVFAFWILQLVIIGGAMDLGLFKWGISLAWVVYLPPVFWDDVVPRAGARVRRWPGASAVFDAAGRAASRARAWLSRHPARAVEPPKWPGSVGAVVVSVALLLVVLYNWSWCDHR